MTWEETKSFLSPCLPEILRAAIAELDPGALQEIRIRAGQPCTLRTVHGTDTLPWQPAVREVEVLAEALCNHSLYARREELRQGYITLRGGHRLGVCGAVQLQGNTPQAFRRISSLCLRIAAQWPGASDQLISYCRAGKHAQSLLIIGPCGSGKTTLLRDAARQLACGEYPLQAAIIDERGEIAACMDGTPQFDIGQATDVITGCSKENAVPWLIRSCAPEVIITDELSGAPDVAAVLDAIACGCAVIASVHGTSLNDLAKRPVMASLMAQRAFSHYAVLSANGCCHLDTVFDRNGSPVRWPS